MLNRSLTLIVALGLILLLAWFQRTPQPAEVARTALIMGTLVEIKGLGSDENKINMAINDAFILMRQIEEEFTTEKGTSPLMRVNRSNAPVEVSPRMAELLDLGLQIQRQSGGAFSMGLGGIKALWRIGEETPQIPTRAELAAVLPDPDGEQLRLTGRMVTRLSPQVQLDLGGIAKGYAVDRALDLLRQAGIESASVNAGGDIGLLGGHGERSWRIGIQHPRRAGELLATIDARDQAVVTSGDYERFFERDGVRYHHIFDPHSGQPARGCQSVSVVADSAALADALATAAFVLGPQRGLQLLEESQQVEGLIVAADGHIVTTAGLKDRLEWR